MNIDNDEQLRQKLAAIEHERWSDWQKWCHKVLGENMPSDVFQDYVWPILIRWEKQANTAYNDLTDKEKASDMEQVDRYWPLIQEYIAAQRQALRDEVEKAIKRGYPIYLTTDDVAGGNMHDDVVRHWNQLRKHQLTAISTIFEGKEVQ